MAKKEVESVLLRTLKGKRDHAAIDLIIKPRGREKLKKCEPEPKHEENKSKAENRVHGLRRAA